MTRSAEREFTVSVDKDILREGNWTPLGAVTFGAGDQSSARRVVAYAALPVTVPLDACAVVIGTAVVWVIWIPAFVLWGVGVAGDDDSKSEP